MVKEKQYSETSSKNSNKEKERLFLLNDDVNTFDHVIESLMEVCQFNIEQAEQCAVITHYKGKCCLKNGNKSELLSIKEKLSERKLTTLITN